MDKKDKIQKIDVHIREKNLLEELRKRFRFGEVVIEMRDGLPYRIKRSVEYKTLSDFSTDD